MKVVIIGAVAAGASAAARLRRLDENAEIVLLERGGYMSYANCGLPYHMGGVIPERDSLLVMPEEKFESWFNIDVRLENEVTAIDRDNRCVVVRHAGKEYRESYDKLLIATGSRPSAPSVPGDDDPRILSLWTIPDMDEIIRRLGDGARHATVIGAGFIGLEAVENLRARGLDVTLIQRSQRVLPTLDVEMAPALIRELAAIGVEFRPGRQAASFAPAGSRLGVRLDDGETLETDFVIRSIGVEPNSELARAAGLELGPHGHIVVNAEMQTGDPDIYAAGDVVEVANPLTGDRVAIALAGPANKEGRIAADNIAGLHSTYPGSLGASVVKVGRLTAASVGMTEMMLQKAGVEYRKLYLHPAAHASYYPGGGRLDIKLLFAGNGKILGAQIVGPQGVDKRIDTIATAMHAGLPVEELGRLELAYAPPFSSAKDPVNFAGFIAENILRGLSDPVYADALPAGALLLDVREAEEFGMGSIPEAVNLPLGQLRARLGELDKARETVIFCQVGLRGYLAERILRQNGFENVHNLSGGYLSWKQFHPGPVPAPRRAAVAAAPVAPPAPPAPPAASGDTVTLDVRALACPGPVVRLKRQMDELAPGAALKLLAPASFASDLQAWAASSGNELVAMADRGEFLEADLRKAGAPQPGTSLPTAPARHGAAIVLFSNDFDKAMAALIIACGMAASGAKVGIFFTFWGLSVLRKDPAPAVSKSLMGKLFGWMLPRGANRLSLSKMNMGGMGTMMMKQVMASQQVTTLPELIAQARALGVRFVACEMAMNVMGVKREELIEVDDVAGVASFVAMAKESNNTLFI